MHLLQPQLFLWKWMESQKEAHLDGLGVGLRGICYAPICASLLFSCHSLHHRLQKLHNLQQEGTEDRWEEACQGHLVIHEKWCRELPRISRCYGERFALWRILEQHGSLTWACLTWLGEVAGEDEVFQNESWDTEDNKEKGGKTPPPPYRT